jgi:hypothetical protein
MKYLYILLLATLPVGAFAQQPKAKSGPQEVRTGMYLMNLYDLNMDEHSFYADFYLWFKWKGRIDPTNFEFVNMIEKWSMDSEPSGNGMDSVLRDGTKYRIFRVEGRFFHSFALNRFPLDTHMLSIELENPEYPVDSLVYLPDTSGADIRHTLRLVGWNTLGSRLKSTVHDYHTNFGNREQNSQRYSNLAFQVQLARPFSYFALKMMLPLLVVMLVSLGALLLHPSYIDTRSALPIGGLLTAVFLQQTYSGALPDTGYMVLLDKIYLLCYGIIALILAQIVIAGNQLMRAHHNPAPVEKRIIYTERQLALLYALLFLTGVALLCL